MNATKADMKDLYFKHQDVFPFEKYVNCLQECYNTSEDLVHPEFEYMKVRTMLDNINSIDDQVRACVHTARKYNNDDFSGSSKHLERKFSHVLH